jgi:ribosomal protein S5
VLTKCLGTQNPHNVLRAIFEGLGRLKDVEEVARLRGKTVEELTGGTETAAPDLAPETAEAETEA